MRIAVISATALLAVGTLAACSSSDEPGAVGGMTECTMDALATPAQDAATALGADNVYTIDSVDCSDGWAVTGGILGSEADPETGAPTSFIFQAEGQFWIPKTQAQVCGTPNADDPSAVPDDAEIPSALYEAGCLT